MDAAGGSELAALAAKVDELSRVCARLGQENAELRDQVSRLSAGASRSAGRPGAIAGWRDRGRAGPGLIPARAGGAGRPEQPPARPGGTVSRRMIGKALGTAALGVAGATALVEAGTGSAAASDGAAITAGNTTTAESATELKFDGSSAPGMIFLVNDTTFGAGASSRPAALGGWAGGDVANGIYGFTEVNGGDGIVGQVGFGNTTGNGIHGLAAGPGTVGVLAENSDGTALSATSSGTADVAVRASATGSSGRGALFIGSAAQIQLSPGSKSTHPKSGKRGDLYADRTGRLWFCKTGGSTATWHQIA